MPVNMDKPHLWKEDVAKSVDLYNNWFMEFAPKAYRDTRHKTTQKVEDAILLTDYLRNINPNLLFEHPDILPIIRMSTAPPIARDRLIGLACITPNLVRKMEKDGKIPPKMDNMQVKKELESINSLFKKLVDKDIFPWLETNSVPKDKELYRAATVVADRLCGAVADPIIRNTQEKRQISLMSSWLNSKGYTYATSSSIGDFRKMQPGTYSKHLNVPATLEGGSKTINISIDIVIMPLQTKSKYPLLIECKSAGDYTNTNKRRKEEATKLAQLRSNYGKKIQLMLFLCGYFDSGYLGYEAAEGLDWIWEHRVDDLTLLGV